MGERRLSFGTDESRADLHREVRGYKLALTWLRDKPPAPQGLASEAITELEAVVDDLREIAKPLEREAGVEK